MARNHDEPQGRFTLKRKGKGVNGIARYHLYRDCPMMVGRDGSGVSPDAEVVELNDDFIALLEMQCCSTCDHRAKLVDYRDLMTLALKSFADAQQGKAGTSQEGETETDAAEEADYIISLLETNGFKIRAVRS